MHTVVVVGHVDHGKSTLLGKLLSETGHLPQDKIETVKRICQDKGIELEPAFFLDALEEEQAQGISIDTTSINFNYKNERFFLIDAPGHIDFLKNMASGASLADYSVLVIDAIEGIRAQTRKHLSVLNILGINKVIVVLNKMDRVQYSQDHFEKLATNVRDLIEAEGLEAVAIVPISAFHGANVVGSVEELNWYTGQTLLELIYSLCKESQAKSSIEDGEAPFRMILQDVYKFDEKRYFAGRVISGKVHAGAEVLFSPSGKHGRIESIEVYPQGRLKEACKGSSVALTLSEQLFVERGELISFPDQLPFVDKVLKARLVWISSHAFDPRQDYLLKLGARETSCRVELVAPEFPAMESSALETSSSAVSAFETAVLMKGDIAEVILKLSEAVAYDCSQRKEAFNKLVLCSSYETVAAGVIDTRPVKGLGKTAVNQNVALEEGYLRRQAKESRQSHKGSVLWFTGLSASGKSTLAKSVESRLFEKGANVVVLDADNVRLGLCADLGFSRKDRAENIRRLAHVAKLFAESGSICIVAAISPYEHDRLSAAHIIGSQDFSEIFVYCPLEICRQRDPKGLYKKVAQGQIESFTGFDLPYQAPQNPELRLDTSSMSVEMETDAVIELLENKGIFNVSR